MILRFLVIFFLLYHPVQFAMAGDQVVKDQNFRSTEDISAEECLVLKSQNDSLRETIRAQNHYLHELDDAAKKVRAFSEENANLKNRLYFLEQSIKSSSEEIRNLMILNAALQKKIDEYEQKQKSEAIKNQ